MFGRIDNLKNQTGLALCRNAIVLPHGPASKRPGLQLHQRGGKFRRQRCA
jgi:hypothetical protein